MPNKTDLKSRVYKFYELNKDKGKLATWEHFKAEGEAKTLFIDT